MKAIKKMFQALIVGCISIAGFLSSIMGNALSYVFSLIAGLACICTAWAWITQDKFFPLFFGISVGFVLLMVIAAAFSDASVTLAKKLKGFIKSR